MQKQDHAPGEPCWVTLATTDPQAVADFYRRLLRWNATWSDGAADMTLDAKPVARIAPVADGEPGWVMHIAVDDYPGGAVFTLLQPTHEEPTT